MPRTGVLLLALMLAVGGCKRKPEAMVVPRPADPIPSAEAVLREFFAAAQAGDCARLTPLLLVRSNAKPPAEYCHNVVEDFQESKSELGSFEQSEIDGRDPNVVLIRTKVKFPTKKSGDEHTWMMRVEWRDGAWKVRF